MKPVRIPLKISTRILAVAIAELKQEIGKLKRKTAKHDRQFQRIRGGETAIGFWHEGE